MKKSELRQIIKEEIDKAFGGNLQNTKTKALKYIEILLNKAKVGNDWGLIDDLITQKKKIINFQSEKEINDIINWLEGEESKPLDKINESQNEKNYEYFYNRISKGVDKIKQMLKENGHID